MIREVKFESQNRREASIKKVLNSYGIASIEEANQICDKLGIDPYLECEQTQNISFENAKWAYVVGAAIAIKKGCKNFERLWGKTELFKIIAKEYANVRGYNEKDCIELVIQYRNKFWKKYALHHEVGFSLD